MENPCIFNGKFNCDDKSDLTKAGPVRIKTVIGFSKEYNDNIHIELEEKLGENPELTIDCHRCCVSTYTSQQHLKRHKKRESSSSASASQPIKKRRWSIPSFRFQDQCLFCGDACDLSKDKKHPDRWRKAVLCRTAGEKAFKESILVVCGKRNDEIANQVRVRVEGAISDLHAADARYHVDCMTTFMSPKSINAAQNASKEVDETDLAFNHVIDEMMNDRSRLWNTIELFHQYQLFGGKTLLRRTFLKKIQDQLDDVVVLTSPGLASLVVFRNSASSALHLASDSDTEDGQQEYVIIRKLAKVIVDEMKQIAYDKSRYDIRITKEDMATSVSQTLMNLLAAITENLHNTLPALLIGNIVTSVFSNKPTSLQISLGNLIRDSKSLLNKLFQFRVTCSYDEILRFKKSAALAATKSTTLTGIKDGRMGLIQAVADNFDADISSQNGKQSTHSLAILITQPMSETNDDTNDNTITRISKTTMSQAIDFDIPVHRYQGPKIVPMPKEEAVKTVLPLKVLCSCIIAERRAKELDLSFLKDVTTNEGCPEYNGYNTSVTRYQGVSMQPKTTAAYTVSANKKQLMSIICQSIINDKSFHLKHTISNKLVITGSEDAPTEIYKVVVITRQDVATSHEEADNIIVQQAIMCAKDQRGHTVAVIADDTDVFILLMYHYWRERLTCPMIMGSPIQQRSLIDIKATVQAHLAIIPGLPAAHALSGCDTVPTYFGIGKGSVLKNLVAAPSSLSQLGCLDASLPEVIDQATNFIGSCYSSRLSEKTMSDFRYKIWAAKFGNAASSIPKIQSLPPTSEAFIENVKRAHLQTCIWKAALALDPPAVDPTD